MFYKGESLDLEIFYPHLTEDLQKLTSLEQFNPDQRLAGVEEETPDINIKCKVPVIIDSPPISPKNLSLMRDSQSK